MAKTRAKSLWLTRMSWHPLDLWISTILETLMRWYFPRTVFALTVFALTMFSTRVFVLKTLLINPDGLLSESD